MRKDVLREKLCVLRSTDELVTQIWSLRGQTAYFKAGGNISRDDLYEP